VYGENNDDVYTIFDVPAQGNMESFYRVQESGNCYIHAPLLAHWYLTLWGNPELKADDAQFVYLSRLVRNTFRRNHLYRYIFEDGGANSEDILLELMRKDSNTLTQPTISTAASYGLIRESLQAHGPGIVSMMADEDSLSCDISHDEPHKSPLIDSGFEEHSMVVVGVRREVLDGGLENIYFLLQNFWENKQLVEVSREYLRNRSVSHNAITFMRTKALNKKTAYSEKAGLTRVAYCSPVLERACERWRSTWLP